MHTAALKKRRLRHGTDEAEQVTPSRLA